MVLPMMNYLKRIPFTPGPCLDSGKWMTNVDVRVALYYRLGKISGLIHLFYREEGIVAVSEISLRIQPDYPSYLLKQYVKVFPSAA